MIKAEKLDRYLKKNLSRKNLDSTHRNYYDIPSIGLYTRRDIVCVGSENECELAKLELKTDGEISRLNDGKYILVKYLIPPD